MPDYLARHGLRHANYDKRPVVSIPSAQAGDAQQGWPDVCRHLRKAVDARLAAGASRIVVAVECYPGVHVSELTSTFREHLPFATLLFSQDAFLPSEEIARIIAPDLGGDDPIFGRLTRLTYDSLLDPAIQASLRARAHDASVKGIMIVLGPAACLCCDPDLIVYADLPRWEAQMRQRRHEISGLGSDDRQLKPSLAYKRAFFIDWRIADKLKRRTLPRWDFLLDTTQPGDPRLVTGSALREALHHCARRPFRVVPFFDPGPWGGQWMRQVCDLPDGPPNYAWCFDCVPEENSLLLAFGDVTIEIPALDLVYAEPVALLGKAVHGRFGAEFPIRFDFLDTMGGGNLSFQVHPDVDYAREHFGLSYTQDESYYILDAEPGAEVYLGQRDGIEPAALLADLAAAQRGDKPFDDARFAGRFPARPHDHFLIPAGTLHCSGAGSMVLEISATPYIFTFKLWDWNRLGLDGLPRPVNLERGRHVIRWERDESYARAHLVNQVKEIAQGAGWREERTGLHEAEFIETRRHWFTAPVTHETRGSVNVLNLVQGSEAIVESPTGAFEPFVVHYAETFIVPAAVGAFRIRPTGATGEHATLKATVRIYP